MTCNTNSLLQIIHNAGLNSVMSIDPAYDRNEGFLGYAIIQFGILIERESFVHTSKLEQTFRDADHSNVRFNVDSPRQGRYLWVAKQYDRG